MTITQFELQDIGLHKHIKADINSPLVGLLGKNGSGKSTILGFLGFLFTGTMPGDDPDAQETFVRYWGRGQEGDPSNGWGRVKFIQHGVEGEIFRQVGKTPKRWLKWGDGPKITAAKEIEATLTDILGSNRKAMTQAIFIPQGALDKLFFGTDTEREVMFVKLLQLGHMEKIEKMISDKINQVSAGMQDLSLLVDDVGAQRNVAEVALADLEKQLGTTRDWAGELNQLRAYRILVAQADAELSNAEAAGKSAELHSTRLRELLSSSECRIAGQPATSSSAAREAAEVLRQEYRGLQVEKDAINASQTLISNWQGLQARITEVNVKKEKLEREYEELRPVAEDDVAAVVSAASAIKTWNADDASHKAAKFAADAANAAVVDYDTTNPLPDQGVITALETAAGAAKLLTDTLSMTLKTWSTVAGSTTSCCPVCASDFDTASISPEKLEVLKQQETKAILAHAGVKKELDAARKVQQDYHTNRAAVFGRSQQAQAVLKQRTDLLVPCPFGNLEELEARAQRILAAQAQRQVLVGPLRDANTEVDKLKVEFALISPGMVSSAMQNFQPAKLPVIQARHAVLEKEGKALEELAKTCQPSEEGKAAELRRQSIALTKQLELVAACETASKAFSDTLVSIMEQEQDNVEPVLEVRVEVRQELAGRVKQALEQADAIRKRQDDLNAKLESEARRKALKSDLIQLKNTFARGGLPMRYVRYKFEQLAEITRQGLMELEASFTVQADPANSVAFTFTSLTEAEPYVMSQSKLSGGQKVRLSTAFLLAVQKLLVPEVAFLCLDEPSLHLDSDGKESLKEMLIGLSGRLGNTQSQIWICDHAPELEPAFGSVIRL